MNVRDNFPGTGMQEASQNYRMAMGMPHGGEEALAAAVADDLARELPTQTAVLTGRAALEKSIADDRGEEARILAIIAQHAAKHRQVKANRRAKEDCLDSLLASEA